MNVSIIYKSLSYVQSNFRILCQVRTDFYYQLTRTQYNDIKLITSFERSDADIFHQILELVDDVQILIDMIYETTRTDKCEIEDKSFLFMIKTTNCFISSSIGQYIINTEQVECFKYILEKDFHFAELCIKDVDLRVISINLISLYIHNGSLTLLSAETMMTKLCELNRTDILKLFIKKYEHEEQLLLSLLTKSLHYNNFLNTKLLLDHHVDPNKLNNSFVIKRKYNIVKLLVHYGYKVNKRIKLELAKNSHNNEVYKLLSES